MNPANCPRIVAPVDDAAAVIERRLNLTNALDAEFSKVGGDLAVNEKRAIYDRAKQFSFSPRFNYF